MNAIAYEEDGWDADGWDEDDYEHEWACCFPDKCLVPFDHMRAECYTLEMAEAWAADFRASLDR